MPGFAGLPAAEPDGVAEPEAEAAPAADVEPAADAEPEWEDAGANRLSFISRDR